jgi:hypothetical protein
MHAIGVIGDPKHRRPWDFDARMGGMERPTTVVTCSGG